MMSNIRMFLPAVDADTNFIHHETAIMVKNLI